MKCCKIVSEAELKLTSVKYGLVIGEDIFST